MAYILTLTDQSETESFEFLEIPIQDTDIEGAADSTTLDGNVFTDFLYLKKTWGVRWGYMTNEDYQRLRGFYLRQFNSGRYPVMTIADTFDPVEIERRGTEYITGDVINYESATRIAGNIEIEGRTDQTTYEGRNLFDQRGTGIFNGYPSNASNSVIVSSSTARIVYIKCQPNTTYTVSKTVVGTGNRFAVFTTTTVPAANVAAQNLIGVKSGDNNVSTYTITTDSAAQYLCAYVRASATSSSVEQVLAGVQMELGSTATPYEPYTGGKPTPNPIAPQAVRGITGNTTFRVHGNNILDAVNLSDDANTTHSFEYDILTVTNTTAQTSRRARQSITAQVKANPGSTLRFTAEAIERTVETGSAVVLAVDFDNTLATSYHALIDVNGISNPYQIPADTSHIERVEVQIFSNNTNVAQAGEIRMVKPMLQIGTNLPYTPYMSQTYPLNLGSIELNRVGEYADRIYLDGGTWKLEKRVAKYTITGAEDWSFGNIGSGHYMQFNTTILPNVGDRQQGISNAYRFKYYASNITTLIQDGEIGVNQASKITIRDDRFTNKTDFVNFLTQEQPVYYYPSSTITTQTITDVTLISQLFDIANANLGHRDGTFELTASNGTVAGLNAEIETFGYDQEPRPIFDRVTVRMTLKDGGVVDNCSGREGVELSMRESEQ